MPNKVFSIQSVDLHGSGIRVCRPADAGDDVANLEVDALSLFEVADFFVASFGEVVQGGNEVFADSGCAVGVTTEDDGDFALSHHAEHFVSGIHLGVALVEAGGIHFHGNAGFGDTIERGGDGVFNDGKAPTVWMVVFH